MQLQELIKTWFQKWEEGDFLNLPITDKFKHTSPYGTTNGKETYISLVEANKDKFLGHRFEIHDAIYSENKSCVRYSAIQPDFRLEVTEWYFPSGGLIDQIIAYYNIEGEISEERKLAQLDDLSGE